MEVLQPHLHGRGGRVWWEGTSHPHKPLRAVPGTQQVLQERVLLLLSVSIVNIINVTTIYSSSSFMETGMQKGQVGDLSWVTPAHVVPGGSTQSPVYLLSNSPPCPWHPAFLASLLANQGSPRLFCPRQLCNFAWALLMQALHPAYPGSLIQHEEGHSVADFSLKLACLQVMYGGFWRAARALNTGAACKVVP